MTATRALNLALQPLDNARLQNLCGALDENLRQIEAAFDVTIARRGEHFRISGDPAQSRLAARPWSISTNRQANRCRSTKSNSVWSRSRATAMRAPRPCPAPA